MMVWGGYLKDTSTKHMPEIPILTGGLCVNPNPKKEPHCFYIIGVYFIKNSRGRRLCLMTTRERHPQTLTSALKKDHVTRKYIFQPLIFKGTCWFSRNICFFLGNLETKILQETKVF